jgi:hypothetical protein
MLRINLPGLKPERIDEIDQRLRELHKEFVNLAYEVERTIGPRRGIMRKTASILGILCRIRCALGDERYQAVGAERQGEVIPIRGKSVPR